MQHAYTVHAVLGREKKRVPCASAWIAVEQRNLLTRQGWGVSISDHLGAPMSDRLMDAQAAAEMDAARKGAVVT